MFGAYIADPNSPENLEKKKSGEVSAEQLETANKWSAAMEDVGEQGAPEATAEAEPTIPETEPQLQAAQEAGQAAEATDLPTDDLTTSSATDEGLPSPDEPQAEAPVAEATTTAAEAAAEAPAAEEAPAIQKFAQDTSESTFNPLPAKEQIAGKMAAEAAQAQSFSNPGESDAINAHVVDDNNLVAKEVSANLDGGIGLNEIGQKLEGDGVDIQAEADALSTDISDDKAAATTAGDMDNAAHDAVTANNLAVEAGAKALAAKEAAGEAMANAAHGSGDAAMDAIERANASAAEAIELAGTSEEVAEAAGVDSPDAILEDTKEMAKEAQEIAGKADEVASAKEAEGDEESADGDDKKEEEAGRDAKEVFKDYDEMNEIDDKEIGTITG